MRTEHAQFDDPNNALSATAPYNFVRLPDSWLTAGDEQLADDHDAYDTARKSGWITISVTALTPLFIRGTLTPREYNDLGDDGRPKAQHEFFQPAQHGRIPGSTLRGMTRNLVEILSQSRVKDTFDKPLHFRTFDGSAVAKHYAGAGGRDMVTRNGGAYASNVRAGYMKKEGGGYKLYPAQELNGSTFYRIEGTDVEFPIGAEWDRKPVWFLPAVPAFQRQHKSPLWYAKLARTDCKLRDQAQYGKDRPAATWHEGMLIVSGNVASKHLHWIVGPPAGTSIKTFSPEAEEITTYRAGGVPEGQDQFSVLPANENDACACFYKLCKCGKIHFGHTGMFRLPYHHTPQKLLDSAVGPTEAPGLAEQIFGTAADSEAGRAGSIFFEDAFLTSSQDSWQDIERQPRVLGTPHPTAFPHYVAQDNVEVKMKDGKPVLGYNGAQQVASDRLKHWDSPDATPRGSKLYWHRWPHEPGHAAPWYLTAPSDAAALPAPIRAANVGLTFSGRVRFDNLTDVQLGALLFGLQLPTGRAHKLGMGKPLGLGSVRLECELTLVDRFARYGVLFSLDGQRWEEASAAATSEVAEFQNAFAGWVLGRQGAATDILWLQPRMRELDAMLDYDGRPDINKTEYLPGPNPPINTGDFGKRKVLPGPLHVLGRPEGGTGINNPSIKGTAGPAGNQPGPQTKPAGTLKPPAQPQTGNLQAEAGSVPADVETAKTAAVSTAMPPAMAHVEVGQWIEVDFIERVDGHDRVRLPDGSTLDNQNVGSCQLNQRLKMKILRVEDGNIVELTRKKL